MKIRYYGHNGVNTGYGRAANEMVEALATTGAQIEVSPLGSSNAPVLETAAQRFFKVDAELTTPDAIIVHTLPLSVDRVIASIPDELADVPTVVYTTWEALEVPERVMQAVRGGDALWVPSKATAVPFARARQPEDPKVYVWPHAYDDTRDHTYSGDRPPAPYTFYWVGAWSGRKNPAGLIRAFVGEFDMSEHVRLLIQCRGLPPQVFAQALAMSGLPRAKTQHVLLSNRDITEPELWSVHALGDTFVTATHGEAWNLPAFEAMLAGRHVIAPAGQGSDEFLEDTTAHLYRASQRAPAFLDVRMADLPAGSPPGAVMFQTMGGDGLTSRCHWQEPDLHDLQEAMRQAFTAKTRTIQVDYDVADTFGRRAVGRRAVQLLEEIRKR